jgi:hypothetical protein
VRIDDEADRPPEEPAPFEGFATGGLMGLLHGLDAVGTSDEGVDDPEALRRAEEAVAHDAPVASGSLAPIDEAWETVAMQTRPGGLAGLEDVARALDSEAVPVGWAPYALGQALGLTIPGAEVRVYSVQVPASYVARANEILAGAPPEGVTYGRGAQPRPRPDAGESASESGFDRAEPRPAVRVGGPELSDNERMERLAGGRRSGCGIAVILIGALLLFVIALTIILRG